MADIHGRTAEEKSYDTYKSRFPWLQLITDNGETFLGCSTCAKGPHAGKKGFSAQKYKVGKYFYARTLQQHETKCPVHAKSVQLESAPKTPDQQGLLEPSEEGRGSPAGSQSSKSPAVAQESPGSLSSQSSSMSPHDVQVLYRNLMCAAYLTMKQGSAASCWRLLTSYARFCEGKLPTCQDSDDIFRECAGVIDEKLVRACISDLQRSRYWALSVDEKDRMMILLISYFDTESGKLATLPLGYKDLSGFEAADLFLIVERFVAEHGLNKQDLLCFSADGASVMGTRRSQGDMRGDNLAKRLQEFAGHPLIVTHCAAHRLQLCVSACWSDEYFKDLVPWRKQTNFSSRSYPTPRKT